MHAKAIPDKGKFIYVHNEVWIWRGKVKEGWTRFTKISNGEYLLNDGADEVGTLLILTGRFEHQSWLYSNLKLWKTFDDEEGKQDVLKVVLED